MNDHWSKILCVWDATSVFWVATLTTRLLSKWSQIQDSLNIPYLQNSKNNLLMAAMKVTTYPKYFDSWTLLYTLISMTSQYTRLLVLNFLKPSKLL